MRAVTLRSVRCGGGPRGRRRYGVGPYGSGLRTRIDNAGPARGNFAGPGRVRQELLSGSPGGLIRALGTASLLRFHAASHLAYWPFLIR